MQRSIIIPLLFLLVACGNGTSPGGNSWYQPTPGTSWQWQINGTLNTSYDVEVYDIDLENTSESTITALHHAGRFVICYFSAGTYENFRNDADLFPSEVLGTALEDYPDEQWLDIRADEVFAIMEARLDSAVTKGCDGVEPDNVDGYSNDNGFNLTANDQLIYNIRIANAAHERNLSVALKNDLDQVAALVDYFDFAVNEQCHEFAECEALSPFIAAGKAVFNTEYDQTYVDDANERDNLCEDANENNLSTLILPTDLDDTFRFSC